MTARIYLESSADSRVSPSWSAGWNKTSGAGTLRASKFTTGTTRNGPVNSLSGTSGHFTSVSRHILGPLVDGPIEGTVKGQIACNQTAIGDNVTLAIALKVVKSDGTDRGILLGVSASDDTSTTPPEMSGTTTNRRVLDVNESASLTLTPVQAVLGDFLVIELGGRQNSSSTFDINIFGGTDQASDYGENDTDTGAKNCWIEFSGSVNIQPLYFNSSAAVPPDNDATGAPDNTTQTLVPPTGMLAGDLVVVCGQVSNATTGNITVANAGGQTWTGPYEQAGNDQNLCIYWCAFNGTWSANPTFTCAALAGTQPYSVIMHVWRPPTTAYNWALDVAFAGANQAAATTITITGQTVNGDVVTLATWCSNDDNTWSNLVGTGWSAIGPAQQRNLAGADQSMTWANYISSLGNADGADFDGTNDYMTRGAGLTGAVDSKSGILSVWVRIDAVTVSSLQPVLTGVTSVGGATDRFYAYVDAAETFGISVKNAAGTEILGIDAPSVTFAVGGWYHVLVSWDLNTGGARSLYINDVSSVRQITFTNDIIDYTLGDWGVGALANGSVKFNGAIAELYFAPGQYLDFSVEANRRKFITARGLPVDLGLTGLGPTGVQPLVYLSNRNGEAVANFATNKGSGGNFTITGTLDQVSPVLQFDRTFTGNVSKDMGGVGTNAGVSGIVSFKAVPPISPQKLRHYNQSIIRAANW